MNFSLIKSVLKNYDNISIYLRLVCAYVQSVHLSVSWTIYHTGGEAASIDSRHPSIVDHRTVWSGRLSADFRVHSAYCLVYIVSCRAWWHSRAVRIAAAAQRTTTIVSRRRWMMAWSAQACQTIRIQCGLIEILGRFVCPVNICRRRLAKPDVAQLLEAFSNRTNLLFRRLHFEVKLRWLTSWKLRVHSRVWAWHFRITQTAATLDR